MQHKSDKKRLCKRAEMSALFDGHSISVVRRAVNAPEDVPLMDA